MNAKRSGIHLTSVALLLLWAGIMLYFYLSGRITHYLQADGLFRPMVLWSSIGLIVLALFNLLTMNAKEATCCAEDGGHDHDHGHDQPHDHDHAHKHGHEHGHSHEHKDGCCGGHGHDHGHSHSHEHKLEPAHEHGDAHGPAGGHDHSLQHKHNEDCCGGHDHGHKHDHAQVHEHGPGCGHDHGHHDHDHGHAQGCCGHDHGHKHDHGHSHEHAGHAHGILEDSGNVVRLIAIFLLVVPMTLAAALTQDTFSARAAMNKGVYIQNYGVGARTEEFSLKRERPGTGNTNAVTTTPAPDKTVASTGTPPASTAAPGTTPGAQDVMPKVNVAEVEKQAAKGAETKSYGSFTLADLEAQVPKSKDGNFMLEVTELYYTAGDKEVQTVLAGQPVETIAQVLPEKVNNEKGTRLRLFRMLVQCCAADARPYSIPVEFGKAAPDFKEMTWVKVVGKMSFQQEGGQTVPVLEATQIEETAAPENQMIY